MIVERPNVHTFGRALLVAAALGSLGAAESQAIPGSNPIVRDVFTADPAPVVIDDTVYPYGGHDNAEDGGMCSAPDRLCDSSKVMKHWTARGKMLSPADFS